MRTAQVAFIPAGKCTVRDCENEVTDGKLHCLDCREGRYPCDRKKPEQSADVSKVKKSSREQKQIQRAIQPSEAELRVAIKNWYRLRGAQVWDTEQERQARVDAGLADLIVMRPGKPALFIEVKRFDGTQSPDQKGFQRCVESCGAQYLLPRSLQEVIDFEEHGF